MVTKIGRKGAKSEIQFFNVSAKFALEIKKCFSSAWSFIHDAPIREEVPFKICLKDTEVKKFMEISNYENLEQEEQMKWDSILFPKAHRHLGLTGTLSGITKDTCTKTLHKMRERIKRLKIPNMYDKAQVKCFNMLCNTIHSFVPFQAGYSAGELEKVDREVIKLLKRSRGLSSTDAKHTFFLPSHLGGMGFKSIQDVDLMSTARELEVISNGDSIDSEIFRTRLAAIPNYEDNEIEFCSNHAWIAIKKLAGFGIYLRDKTEHIINAIFSRIEKIPRYQGLGSGNFSNGNKPFLGNGRAKNLEIMFGGPVHRILRTLQSVNWNIPEFRKIYPDKCPIDVRKLVRWRKEACISHFYELTSVYSCWEWINNILEKSIPTDRSKWEFIDIPTLLKQKFPHTYWQLSDEEIKEEAERMLNIDLLSAENNKENVETNAHVQEKYKEIWKYISSSHSPVFVATDGSHERVIGEDSNQSNTETTSSNSTSASFVICLADMDGDQSNNQNEDSNTWKDKPSLPLLCRVASLPNKIGTDSTDVAHGEAFAVAMQEWALPHCIPRILITDSESVRNVLLNLRDQRDGKINRKLIRTMLGGISKALIGNLHQKLNQSRFNRAEIKITASGSHQEDQNTIRALGLRLEKMEKAAIQWTEIPKDISTIESAKYGRWRKDYFDAHEHRIFFKVNSHQLNANGNEIKQHPRYTKLTPNLCFLNMNHHADKTADLGKGFRKGEKNLRQHQILRPPSILRYHFTWGGCIVDRHISDFIRNKINSERLLRLQTKATQGLLWRFINHVSVDWKKINQHKGWKRALMGLSRTHTRSMYKSETYRMGCVEDFNSKCQCMGIEQINPTTSKKQDIINTYSKCMWCPNHITNPTPHGNRKHALLHCTHPDLLHFRNKMTNLIEQKLKNLFVNLREATNEDYMDDIFRKLEKECLKLQQSNIGRCKKSNFVERYTYISMEELKKKYNLDSLMEGCNTRGTFCSELMGIVQQTTARDIHDRDLGILDAFWLGMVPKSLDNIIGNCIKKNKLLNFTRNIPACGAMETDLFKTWSEIKTANGESDWAPPHHKQYQ